MARKRYNKGKRIDMRQGGRVALARGGNRGAKRTATPKERIVRDDRPARTPLGSDDRPMRPNDQPDLPTSTLPQKPIVTKDILRDPAPAPEKERPQTVSISQPQPQAGNIFPEVQQDLQEKQAKLQADLEAKVRKLEAELQLEREKNIRKMNMERPDG